MRKHLADLLGVVEGWWCRLSSVRSEPVAWTYLGLGETTAGLEWLETALAERDPFLGSLMVFPAYDPIREHAKFRRLTHELKVST